MAVICRKGILTRLSSLMPNVPSLERKGACGQRDLFHRPLTLPSLSIWFLIGFSVLPSVPFVLLLSWRGPLRSLCGVAALLQAKSEQAWVVGPAVECWYRLPARVRR